MSVDPEYLSDQYLSNVEGVMSRQRTCQTPTLWNRWRCSQIIKQPLSLNIHGLRIKTSVTASGPRLWPSCVFSHQSRIIKWATIWVMPLNLQCCPPCRHGRQPRLGYSHGLLYPASPASPDLSISVPALRGSWLLLSPRHRKYDPAEVVEARARALLARLYNDKRPRDQAVCPVRLVTCPSTCIPSTGRVP